MSHEAAPTEAQLQAIDRLRNSIRLSDADVAEEAISAAHRAGLHPSMSEAMIELAQAPWHMRHEDVVNALQSLRPPAAVDVLERLATTDYAYLEYDEFDGLARKCTWALADIGTSAARDALVRLAQSAAPQKAAYANRRLAKWEKERDRKLT